MKRHRHTPEQVVRKLREGERILNEGKDLTEVLRRPAGSQPAPPAHPRALENGSDQHQKQTSQGLQLHQQTATTAGRRCAGRSQA